MGGYGSGRRSDRPTVEDGLTLNLSRLFKMGWLKPGAMTSGILRWFNVSTQEEVASVSFESRLGEGGGHIRLRWTYVISSGRVTRFSKIFWIAS